MPAAGPDGHRPRPEADFEPAMPDGAPVAGRDAPIGGQAVLEGVMMRGVSTWSVAVRKPEGDVEVTSELLVSWAKRHRVLRLPVIRGVVALAESLKIGFRALAISATAQLAEEDEQEPIGGFTGITDRTVARPGDRAVLRDPGRCDQPDQGRARLRAAGLVEGVLRTAIFIGYILLISRLPDLRRVFEYHGAEHKTISAFEAGDELTPERAARYSRLHPRCGTSFLLIVMVIAIFVFAPIGLPEWYWLLLSRILGIPLIAGLSYEVIKWAGKNRYKRWVRILMWPGLMLQNLTTREPDHEEPRSRSAPSRRCSRSSSPKRLRRKPRSRSSRSSGSLPGCHGLQLRITPRRPDRRCRCRDRRRVRRCRRTEQKVVVLVAEQPIVGCVAVELVEPSAAVDLVLRAASSP